MPVLSPAQLESFLERGFCILENAFDRQLAEDTVRRAYTRMGFTPHEPASWANFDQCLLHSISRCILPLFAQSSDQDGKYRRVEQVPLLGGVQRRDRRQLGAGTDASAGAHALANA